MANKVPGNTRRRSSTCEIDDGDKQCILCRKTDRYMSQYGNWGDLEKEFVMKHLGSAPSDDSPICKKHLIEAKRHHGTPGLVPKWAGQHRQSTTPGCKCINPKCAHTQCVKLIKPAFVPVENLEAALGIQTSTTNPLLLCEMCYQDMYRLLHPPTNCASCGAMPKTGTRFCRHSPDAYTVSEHLRNTVGSDTSIHPNDLICSTCYKVHSSIIKALESKQQEPDCTLQSVMDIWIVKCNDKNTDALTRAVPFIHNNVKFGETAFTTGRGQYVPSQLSFLFSLKHYMYAFVQSILFLSININ